MTRPAATLLAGLLLTVLVPASAMAQGYRAEIDTRGTSIELRGLARDSLPVSQVPGEGLRRVLDDGTIATCIPDEFCRWYGSAGEETVAIVTQDVEVVAWPGTIRGLSAHVHVRGRFGTDDLWPRSDQEVEALTAYARYEIGDFRVQGGRIVRTNGLGYTNFDGASILWRGLEPYRFEAYGGWSLAPGLDSPRDEDPLVGAVDFPTDKRAYVVGFDATARYGSMLVGAFGYKREMRTDRLGLYSERVSGDATLHYDRFTVDASADYDLVFEEFNEARLRVAAPVAAGVHVVGEVRRYTPHFELWTIWGAFSPVGYDEGRVTAAWDVPDTDLRLEGGGAYRSYDAADAGADFVEFEENGWRGYGRGSWRRAAWFVSAGYSAESGSGAARYGGDAAVGYEFSPGASVEAFASSTQSFSEFRLGEQITNGGGVSGSYRWRELRLSAGWAAYSVAFQDRPRVENWTQQRGWIGASYAFGTEVDARRGGYGADR